MVSGAASLERQTESKSDVAFTNARRARDEAERRRAIDEILDEVLKEKPSKISLSKILDESRR